MASKPPADCPSAIVGLLDPQGGYRGTGFFVSPRLVMTCEHVVVGASTIAARRLLGGETLVFRLLDTDPDRDLAILQLEEGDQEREPIQPLVGLAPDLLRQLDGNLTTIGVEAATGRPLRVDNLQLRLVVGSLGASDGVVREAQIDGGAPHGLSGAPVFAGARRAAWASVGMMVLGGSGSGQSLLRGPDAMIPLWQQAGVLDEIRSRPAREVVLSQARRARAGKVRGWKLVTFCWFLTCAAAGLTFSTLRATRRPAELPPAWIPNELFPGLTELFGVADDLQQFSRMDLLVVPKNPGGFKQQTDYLNAQVRAFNCTSDYLLSGKDFFRDRLSAVRPERLKDLVVRVSEPRFPARYTPAVYRPPSIGPPPPGEATAMETILEQHQRLVLAWSENVTHLDGPIKETKEYLALLEKELLQSLRLPTLRCDP